MSRAAVQYERQPDGDFKAVGVWLGTTTTLQSRFLPGHLEDFARRTHENARPPVPDGQRSRGTWEDWIDYALDALSNGHDLMVGEVKPELTVDLLYAREVLGLDGDALRSYEPRGVPNVSTRQLPDLQGRRAARA